MERLLLTVEQVADTLAIKRTKVYELLSEGELPVIKIGRATRIPASAVREWVVRRLAAGESATAEV